MLREFESSWTCDRMITKISKAYEGEIGDVFNPNSTVLNDSTIPAIK